MYPTITDFIYELTGAHVPTPIQTFGFFMALAFLTGTILSYLEFRRLEKLNILRSMQETITVGAAPSIPDVLLNTVLGFLVGFKLFAALFDWTSFSGNPQAFLLSGEGSALGGIVMAVIMGYSRYYEQKKQQLDNPIKKSVAVFPHERLGDFVILAAVVGILGSKVFTWFEDIPAFLANPWESITAFSGMTYYGGLISAATAIAIYASRKGIPVPRLADVAAPALIMGYGVGRLGCHFSGDGDWGIVNPHARPDFLAWLPDWAWSYTYPHNVNNDGIPIPDCDSITNHCMQLAQGVYPTSVYEFVLAGTIFLILWSLRKRLTVIPGMIFGIYLLLNGLERFAIESIRVNMRYDWFFNLSQAQMIAVGLMLTGITVILLAYLKRPSVPADTAVAP